MVKRLTKNIIKGLGSTVTIAPSGKVVCKKCQELRKRTIHGSIKHDWETVGRTISGVFVTETKRYEQTKK